MDVTRAPLAVPRDLLDSARAVRDVGNPGLAPWKRGKVRSTHVVRSTQERSLEAVRRPGGELG